MKGIMREGKILCAKSWWLNGAKRPKAMPESFFKNANHKLKGCIV